MNNKIIVCPFCGKESACITYEERRLYKLECNLCGGKILHIDSSYDNAVKVFEEIEVPKSEESDMSIKEWAELLNGRKYMEELSPDEEAKLNEQGLVVVFGYSDDNCEFRGAIKEEYGCYGGGKCSVNKDHGTVTEVDENSKNIIDIIWCNSADYTWDYKTTFPCEKFDIIEDNGCDECQERSRGIIFCIDDLEG